MCAPDVQSSASRRLFCNSCQVAVPEVVVPCRAHLRSAVQKVFQEFNDAAVLFVEAALLEPLVKSYLGTPDNGFQELQLPVTHYRALSAEGIDAAMRTQLAAHAHVVFIVRGCPQAAQLVAQHIAEIRRCAIHISQPL